MQEKETEAKLEGLAILQKAFNTFKDNVLNKIIFHNLVVWEDACIHFDDFKLLDISRKLKSLGYQISNIEEDTYTDHHVISIVER